MNLLLYRGEKFNANFYYNSGVDIDHSFLLACGESRTLLVPQMNREYAESVFEGEVAAYKKDPVAAISALCTKPGPMGLDFRSIPASLFLRLSGKFGSIKDVSRKLASARLAKGKGEVALIKKAATLSKKLIRSHGKRPAGTEARTAGRLLASAYTSGAEPAFSPIVACGIASSYPHSVPTAGKISSPLLIDYGVRIGRYNSDITRCFRLGREQEKIYSKLKRISRCILDGIPDMETGAELAALARKLYATEGLAHPPHAIGHGIGLEVHEKPSLSSGSKDGLRGAVMAIEPSVYFARKYGLRHEDLIHFDGKRARLL